MTTGTEWSNCNVLTMLADPTTENLTAVRGRLTQLRTELRGLERLEGVLAGALEVKPPPKPRRNGVSNNGGKPPEPQTPPTPPTLPPPGAVVVARMLCDAAGPMSCPQIAGRVGCTAKEIEKLLDDCDWFTEDGDDRWTVGDRGRAAINGEIEVES